MRRRQATVQIFNQARFYLTYFLIDSLMDSEQDKVTEFKFQQAKKDNI